MNNTINTKNKLIVGVDVAKDFSYFCILTPYGEEVGKPFKVNHTLDEFEDAVAKIKEVEQQYKLAQSIMIMESTGIYSTLLLHFFKQHCKVLMINALQSHSIKNTSIRKVKNDKIDAKRIAELYLFNVVKEVDVPDDNLDELNVYCRDYLYYTDNLVKAKNSLKAKLFISYPGYEKVFSDAFSATSLFILKDFGSPKKFLEADKKYIVENISKLSRRSHKWAEDKYNSIFAISQDALKLAKENKATYFSIQSSIREIENTLNLIADIELEIKNLTKYNAEVQLLNTLPGFSIISSSIILSEIKGFKRFSNYRKLIAFFGTDPSVKQSGNFYGTKSSISKRGNSRLRRILYLIAINSISTRNGKPINPALYEYYNNKKKSKAKKVALVAVMNKIIKYMFAVIRDNKPFRFITPSEHIQSHMPIQA